jgi:hypothetical protein
MNDQVACMTQVKASGSLSTNPRVSFKPATDNRQQFVGLGIM